MRSPTSSTQHRRRVDEVDMTPMIDVVFLLIIFFLVSSHLARREIRHAVDLPTANSGKTTEPDSAPISVSVDEANRLWFGGEEVSLDELAMRLTTGDSESPVRLRVDRTVTYQHIEPVLHRLTQAGVQNLSIATLSSNQSGGRDR